ncbi:MAG: hypothetical protein J4F46_05280 [Dehalococcoidia bacterium]|nr:hypothetical protein [Dehalococcoidia bacterium]
MVFIRRVGSVFGGHQIGIETELVQHDAGVFFGSDPVGASYRRFFADVQMYASVTGIDPQQSLSDLL